MRPQLQLEYLIRKNLCVMLNIFVMKSDLSLNITGRCVVVCILLE